jgi:hypothetical protein
VTITRVDDSRVCNHDIVSIYEHGTCLRELC